MVTEYEPIIAFGEGVAEGLGLNYVWEALKLPGYGIGVIEGIQGPVGVVGLGADDLIELAIGGLVAAYGYKTKNTKRMAQGAGIMTGIGVTKLFEAYGFGSVAGYTPVPVPTARR